MKFKRKAIIGLLVGILLIAAGCGGGNQIANGDNAVANDTNTANNTAANDNIQEDDSGEEMDAMVISAELVLDPALVALDDVSSLIICDYLYDGLTALDDSGAVIPGLAAVAEESDDGLTYVFTLEDDAVFYDGTLVTADVVIDNFRRWFDPEHPLHGSNNEYLAWIEFFKGFRGELDEDDQPISLFDGIEKTDDRTVLIHLNEPMPDFLEILAAPYFSILNPQALGSGDYGMDSSSIDGTGPYRIGIWDDGGLTLVPNPTFWDNDNLPSEDLFFTFE